MPAASPVRIDASLREHFAEFLSRSCGAAIPPLSLTANDLRQFDEGTGKRLAAETASLLERGGFQPDEAAGRSLRHPLQQSVEQADARFELNGFRAVVDRRLQVHAFDPLARGGTDDLFFVKINHAFWEQIYAIFAATPRPERMRITQPDRFRRLYRDSAFLYPLIDLLRHHAVAEQGERRLDHLSFGVSLYAGMQSHPQILNGHATADPDTRQVYDGAAIGLDAFFTALYGDRRVHCSDGCFPKTGLEDGSLRACLAATSSTAGSIIFVVPPHLRGIRLPLAPNARQEVLLLSRGNVYATWLSTLFSCVRHILLRLQHTEHVVVITQSAAFSVVLGLYLREARQALYGSDRRLDFLDLGQVTDIAAPEAGGPWIRRFPVDETALFSRAGSRRSWLTAIRRRLRR